MRKNRMKWLGMFAATGMLFQFGCSVDALMRRIQIGFAEQIGAIPGVIVGDLIFQAIDLDAILNPDGSTDGT